MRNKIDKKNKRIKIIEPKMEFNPGTQKYELVLPLRKTGKKVKIKVSWKWIILLIIALIILIGASLLALKYGLFD